MVRKKNEDCIGFDSAMGLMVLADGMGGHRGGEVASSMSVDSILEALQKQLPKIKPGRTDPELDEAIRLKGMINAFLTQDSDEVFDLAQTFSQLKQTMS